uniref:TNFAIP3-interacting protein 2 n=1 Tax=Calidris pygmaea TaxID=425635 RepID=A0A8C3JV49_9CHAR
MGFAGGFFALPSGEARAEPLLLGLQGCPPPRADRARQGGRAAGQEAAPPSQAPGPAISGAPRGGAAGPAARPGPARGGRRREGKSPSGAGNSRSGSDCDAVLRTGLSQCGAGPVLRPLGVTLAPPPRPLAAPTFTLTHTPPHLGSAWRLLEVQRLNQQLEEKNGEIQQMINQPPYEKEREILRLQKSLAEREKAQATSDVLCRSLTDETHQLQRKLASTAEMCQHLAKCLEEKQRKEKGNSDDQTPTERSNQLLDNETSLQALVCNLRDENRMLKQKVAHVEDLNAKWQKYDASRDEYVKRLHLQLKEMKSQLEQQHGVTSAQTNSDLMHKEIFRLNKLLEEKMNECIKIKRELEDVKKASEGDNERIQMLEEQVLVYKDDFKSERSDRERAQSKIQELQAEVACLQHQLARRQVRKQGDSRDTGSHFRVHTGNQNHMYVQTNVEHLREHLHSLNKPLLLWTMETRDPRAGHRVNSDALIV